MTIAGQVFAKCSTQTVHAIAMLNQGKRTAYGYVFPDGSVITIDGFRCVGYSAADKQPYGVTYAQRR